MMLNGCRMQEENERCMIWVNSEGVVTGFWLETSSWPTSLHNVCDKSKAHSKWNKKKRVFLFRYDNALLQKWYEKFAKIKWIESTQERRGENEKGPKEWEFFIIRLKIVRLCILHSRDICTYTKCMKEEKAKRLKKHVWGTRAITV
jgi:hypothetical protein